MESIIRVCKRCNSLVQTSDLNDYDYQCLTCDEDLYTIETEEKPVTEDMEFYALQEDGDYLRDRDGEIILFESFGQAESFIDYLCFGDSKFNIVSMG